MITKELAFTTTTTTTTILLLSLVSLSLILHVGSCSVNDPSRIGHAVLMRLKHNTEPDSTSVEAMFQNLRTSLSKLSPVQYLITGKNIYPNSTVFNGGLFNVFNNEESLVSYNNDPEHNRIKASEIVPRLEQVTNPLLALDVAQCPTLINKQNNNMCKLISSRQMNPVAHITAFKFDETKISSDQMDQVCGSLCTLSNNDKSFNDGGRGILDMYCSKNIVPDGAVPRNQGYQVSFITVFESKEAMDQFYIDPIHNSILFEKVIPFLNSNSSSTDEPLLTVDFMGLAPCGTSSGLPVEDLTSTLQSKLVKITIALIVLVFVFLAVSALYTYLYKKRKHRQMEEQQRHHVIRDESDEEEIDLQSV